MHEKRTEELADFLLGVTHFSGEKKEGKKGTRREEEKARDREDERGRPPNSPS